MTDQHDVISVMLAEARQEVGVADHKASLVLTGLSVGVAALLAGMLAGDWDPQSRLSGFAEVLWWAGAVFAISAIACAGSAVWPRFQRSHPNGEVHYWGHVSSFDSIEAWMRRQSELESDPEKRNRDQLWVLSSIVTRKYQLIQWSIGLSGAGAVMFIASALIS
ncbi:MAG: Pycsar system effector family protein [Dehalococcoidia bacterium]